VTTWGTFFGNQAAISTAVVGEAQPMSLKLKPTAGAEFFQKFKLGSLQHNAAYLRNVGLQQYATNVTGLSAVLLSPVSDMSYGVGLLTSRRYAALVSPIAQAAAMLDQSFNHVPAVLQVFTPQSFPISAQELSCSARMCGCAGIACQQFSAQAGVAYWWQNL
jgi:hypothetical protein